MRMKPFTIETTFRMFYQKSWEVQGKSMECITLMEHDVAEFERNIMENPLNSHPRFCHIIKKKWDDVRMDESDAFSICKGDRYGTKSE